MCSAATSLLVLVLADVFFGSFAVFIKAPAVMKLDLDPVVFQCYKSFWACATSFLVLFHSDFYWTYYGIASGLAWVPAGIAAVVAVRSIGMSIAQPIWSGLIVLVNAVWGLVVFRESVGDASQTIPGLALLFVGVVSIACTPTIASWLGGATRRADVVSAKPLLLGADDDLPRVAGPLADDAGGNRAQEDSDEGKEGSQKGQASVAAKGAAPRWVGFAAAVFNGLWGGSIYAPMKIAKRNGVKTSGFDYILSFGIGVGIVQVAILLAYGLFRVGFQNRPFFPDFHFRTLWWAGSGAGVFWAVGNFFSLLSVLCLGQAIGYSSCQASLLVSGLWGVFYFKEVRGLSVPVFFAASAVTVAGVFLMMSGKES